MCVASCHSSTNEIPETLNGYTVTGIGTSTFRDSAALTAATLPATLTNHRSVFSNRYWFRKVSFRHNDRGSSLSDINGPTTWNLVNS